ncbi:hypothetical protein L6452_08759 [Arctium lappa]|uniref:Uncharacterized protein n=1 Tax=Arctium lappa TaxID=4217 RepID=A0ACB9DIM6_ARCLA|nr:hypothetical protein L6452_08759 [Arctium lappa]
MTQMNRQRQVLSKNLFPNNLGRSGITLLSAKNISPFHLTHSFLFYEIYKPLYPHIVPDIKQTHTRKRDSNQELDDVNLPSYNFFINRSLPESFEFQDSLIDSSRVVLDFFFFFVIYDLCIL